MEGGRKRRSGGGCWMIGMVVVKGLFTWRVFSNCKVRHRICDRNPRFAVLGYGLAPCDRANPCPGSGRVFPGGIHMNK